MYHHLGKAIACLVVLTVAFVAFICDGMTVAMFRLFLVGCLATSLVFVVMETVQQRRERLRATMLPGTSVKPAVQSRPEPPPEPCHHRPNEYCCGRHGNGCCGSGDGDPHSEEI